MVRKKKFILFLLFLAIVLCSYIEYDYQKYLQNKAIDASIVEVIEGLSINFTHGKKVEVNQREIYFDFSITNLSSEEKKFIVQLQNLVGDAGSSLYEIKEENGVQNKIGPVEESELLQGSILAGETKRFHVTIQNNEEKNYTFSMGVDYLENDESFASILLANNEIKEEAMTTFDVSSQVDEGLIHKVEQEGDVYYFRGNVVNNYVSFAGFLWRVVKINSDRSVKLILNTTLDDMVKFNESDTSFENSFIYQTLSNWYDLQLKEYDDLIASTMYCYDDSVLTEENLTIQYLPAHRLFVDKIPTYSCSGSYIPLKIALLSADEAVFAGASENANNSFYLGGSFQSSWWTMTPSKKEKDVTYYMAIGKDGKLEKEIGQNTNLFYRPVLSLSRRVRVDGMGTMEEPYIVMTN